MAANAMQMTNPRRDIAKFWDTNAVDSITVARSRCELNSSRVYTLGGFDFAATCTQRANATCSCIGEMNMIVTMMTGTAR